MPLASSVFRRFTFKLDGVIHSTAIFHTPGLAGGEQERELERQFSVWLEVTYPGARAAGRISNIAFIDDVSTRSETGPVKVLP